HVLCISFIATATPEISPLSLHDALPIWYGRAEAMLERKWPEKYNGPGHVRWAGRIYGSGLTRALRLRRARVYHGIWGLAPYQSLYEPAPGLLGSLLHMPEWLLAFARLVGL